MEKLEQRQLTITLTHNLTTQHFFIDFRNEIGYITSLKITEPQALAYSKDLGIKIMIG